MGKETDRSIKIYQGNTARTGVVQAVGTKSKPDLLWSYDFGNCLREEWSHSFIHEGKLFLTVHQMLHAFDIETHEIVWTQSDCHGTPTIVGDTIYTVGRTTMKALDVGTGKVIWSTETPEGEFFSFWEASNCVMKPSPAVTGDVIYFCSTDTPIYAVNRSDGTILWQARSHSDFSVGTPTVGEGKIFASTFHSPNPDMPDEAEWKRKSEENPPELPYSYQFPGQEPEWLTEKDLEGTLVFRHVKEVDGKHNPAREKMADASFVAFDAKTGEQIWRTNVAEIFGSPYCILAVTACRDGILYGSVSPPLKGKGLRSSFVAMEAATGKVLWKVEIPLRRAFAPISLRGNFTYVSGVGQGILQIDLSTHEVDWLYQNNGIKEVCNRTIVEPEGVMYFGIAGRKKTEMAGAFVALDLATRRELWRWNFPGAQDMEYPYICGAPAIHEGRVYLASMTDEDEICHNSKFYCLGAKNE